MVRVTWLGARAYANYYGKRLPTFDEWKLLQEQFADTRKTQTLHTSPVSPTDVGYNAHLEMMKEFSKDARQSLAEDRQVVKEWLSVKTDGGASSRVVAWADGSEAQTPVLWLLGDFLRIHHPLNIR